MCFSDKRGGRDQSAPTVPLFLPSSGMECPEPSKPFLKPRGMGGQDYSDSSLDVTEPPNQC